MWRRAALCFRSVVACATFFLCSGAAVAFRVLSPPVHEDMTVQALDAVVVLMSDGEPQHFSDFLVAKYEVVWWNIETDSHQFSPAYHFDDDRLFEGSDRIKKLKAAMVREMIETATPDHSALVRSLGAALHTVQDFYAHSNWVERNSPQRPDLGEAIIVAAGGSGEICDGLNQYPPPFQTNKWTTGHVEYCPVFPLLCDCVPWDPPTVCIHSGPSGGCGLNKDSSDRANFPIARAGALLSSVEFVTGIFEKAKLDADRPEDYNRGVCAFLGIPEEACDPCRSSDGDNDGDGDDDDDGRCDTNDACPNSALNACTCTDDSQCAPFNCRSGFCTIPNPEGSPCATDSECAGFCYADTGTCGPTSPPPEDNCCGGCTLGNSSACFLHYSPRFDINDHCSAGALVETVCLPFHCNGCTQLMAPSGNICALFYPSPPPPTHWAPCW